MGEGREREIGNIYKKKMHLLVSKTRISVALPSPYPPIKYTCLCATTVVVWPALAFTGSAEKDRREKRKRKENGEKTKVSKE